MGAVWVAADQHANNVCVLVLPPGHVVVYICVRKAQAVEVSTCPSHSSVMLAIRLMHQGYVKI